MEGWAMRVLVIGAGVVGLTTAITLQDAGHDVVIWADKAPGESTSSKAAALWEPFQPQMAGGRASPEALAYQRDVLAWGAFAYGQFESELSDAPSDARGVKRVRVLELKRNDDPPWWSGGELGERLRLTAVPTADLMRDTGPYAARSYTLDSIVVDMSRYLAYLEARFTEGQPERLVASHHVTGLTAITGFDAVVNCAGLGARDLAGGEDRMYALRGQIVRLRRTDLPVIAVAGAPISVFLDGDQEAVDAGGLTYLVARFDDIVLGGTYERLDRAAERGADAAWSSATRRGILSRCADALAALGAGDAPLTADLRRYAASDGLPAEARDDGGLRPFRDPIRVERDDDLPGGARLVHNYGHGGAGVTLSWGCAQRVRELLGSR
jgi:D-amino-acid oxidase